MPVTLLTLWGNGIKVSDPAKADASVVVVRPWGYEVRADYIDGKEIYNETLTFAKEPDQKTIEQAAVARLLELQKRYALPTKAEKIAQLQADLTTAQSELDSAVARKAELLAKISTEEAEPMGDEVKS